MTQAELNREVARATGEDVSTIARRGFSLVADEGAVPQATREPLVVDWDDVQARRSVAVCDYSRPTGAAQVF